MWEQKYKNIMYINNYNIYYEYDLRKFNNK